MSDTYANYSELSAVEVEGVDYNINTLDNNSDIIALAIHGGGIERGSGELAQKVTSLMSCDYYEFEGIKPSGNSVLHITSTNFDEPIALSMVRDSRYCVSLHGAAGSEYFTFVGGLDTELADEIKRELNRRSFNVITTPYYLNATDPENITNKTTRLKGVQIEISKGQRDLFILDDTILTSYATAIKVAIENVYEEENNMSRSDNTQNILGDDSADNRYSSANVAANRDGSIIERMEHLIGQLTFTNTDTSVNSVLGTKVTRAAADIFDGTQKALFTVAGGRVLITNIFLEVSGAAIDAGASNANIVTNPTIGTDADICDTLDINADEEGSLYGVTGVVTTAMAGGSGGGTRGMYNPYLAAEGTIDLVTVADVGTGGALGSAEIWYVALDDGATITATA